jgi:hypothetical protein
MYGKQLPYKGKCSLMEEYQSSINCKIKKVLGFEFMRCY